MEYRNENNGYVSIHDPDEKSPSYVCLENDDWIRIRRLLKTHKASTWSASYNSSASPSDGATHIVVDFPNMSVDMYDRVNSAPKDLGIDAVYNGIRSIVLERQ